MWINFIIFCILLLYIREKYVLWLFQRTFKDDESIFAENILKIFSDFFFVDAKYVLANFKFPKHLIILFLNVADYRFPYLYFNNALE